MNESLKSLVKKIFLTATAAISTTSVTANTKVANHSNNNDLTNSKIFQPNFNQESKNSKLVLEKPSKFNLGRYLFTNHASHASHSSHASHASHVSGYTQPTQPKVTTSNNQTRNNSVNGKESTSKKTKTQILFKLGSRVLKSGMIGTDIAELQDLLIQKGYKIKITAKYDSETFEAVKKFQKGKNIEVTGEVGALTLYYLRKK